MSSCPWKCVESAELTRTVPAPAMLEPAAKTCRPAFALTPPDCSVIVPVSAIVKAPVAAVSPPWSSVAVPCTSTVPEM
ncbi:hypothetical protein D3C83_68000 [compost metagenome]